MRSWSDAFRGLLVCLLVLIGSAERAQALPEQSPVAFPNQPTSGQAALDTLAERRLDVIRHMACGDEEGFLDGYADKVSTGEDAMVRVLAKAAWLLRHSEEQRCNDSHAIGPNEAGLSGRLTAAFPGPPGQPSPCADAMNTTAGSPLMNYTLSDACMRLEVNTYLGAMQKDKQVGSSGLPCLTTAALTSLALFTDGEWDVTLRELTRIRYMDRLTASLPHLSGQRLLAPSVEAHLDDTLLDISGQLGPEAYPLLGCGDREDTTGDPAQRAADASWTNALTDPVQSATDHLLQDLFRWLIILLILAGLAGAAAVLAALLPGAVGALVAGVIGLVAVAVVAAVVFAGSITMPETENHRLMIETARYLKNQADIQDDTAAGIPVNDLPAYQQAIREWLLTKTQSILTADYKEYNGRPYQRYSLRALLNLYDFATDPDLTTAAAIDEDYAYAKFVVGENEGRRLAPFRRRIDAIDSRVRIPDLHPEDLIDASLFSQNTTEDYLLGVNELYSGQVSELQSFIWAPNAAGVNQLDCAAAPCISHGAAGTALVAATSAYAPDLTSLDLALADDYSAQQTIHHAGLEIYSRGPGFLITAGGVRAPRTAEATFNCPPLISLCGDGIGIAWLTNLFAHHTDEGFGVPTTLMLSGLPGGDQIDNPGGYRDFISIAGKLWEFTADTATFDRNACVWGGFACGANISIPPSLTPGPGASAGCGLLQGRWVFIDTDRCPRRPTHRFFITVYMQSPCPAAGLNAEVGCTSNVGFFYIVAAPATEILEAFAQRVRAANPDPAVANPATGGGVFHAPDGHVITYDVNADGMTSPQIVNVDGRAFNAASTWPLAQGDVIDGGGGRVAIHDRRIHRTLTLDASDREHPKRTVDDTQ